MLYTFVQKKMNLLFNYKRSLFSPITNHKRLYSNNTSNFTYTFIKEEDNLGLPILNSYDKSVHIKNQQQSYAKKVGNATWTLLHSISDCFPDNPSKNEKNDVLTFIRLLATLYPCENCKDEFIGYLRENMPDLKNRKTFVAWTCNFHNYINQKIGKNIYDCNSLF